MKEFGRTLKQTIMVSKNDIWVYAIVSALGGVVGIMVTLAILYMDGTGGDYGQIGAMLAVIAGGIILGVGGIVGFPHEFNLAVSLGKTRRYLVLARYINWMINTAVVIGITLLIGMIENVLYPMLYPQAVCEMDVLWFFLHPEVLFSCLVCVPMLIIFFGSMSLRFGNKFLWFFWALTMGFNLFGNRIAHTIKEQPDSLGGQIIFGVIEFFMGAGMVQILLVFTGLTIAGIVGSVLLLRKQQVTA